jgi:hypothetical protein
VAPGQPAGIASGWLHDQAQVGTVLQVRAASGQFVFSKDDSVPPVLITGGIGITPILSMLKAALAAEPDLVAHLFYGVRNGRDHAFKTVLEALARAYPGFDLHVVYADPAAGDVLGQDYDKAGLISLDLLKQSLPHGRHAFYVRGPDPMMKALIPALCGLGCGRGRGRHPPRILWPADRSAQRDVGCADARCAGARRDHRVSAVGSHAGLAGAGCEPAGLCRAPFDRRGCRLSVRQLRHLRDATDLGTGRLCDQARPRHRIRSLPAVRRYPGHRFGVGRMTLRGSLFSREVVPFYLALLALLLATLAVDAALHLLNLVWIGKWLGIPGVLLICGSFGSSLRKRKLITRGSPATLLRLHERMAWAGSLLITVHAGIHFNAVLAWLAIGAMLLNIASGLTAQALEDRLYWDSLTYDTVKQWRVIHYPITLAFAVPGSAHIISSVIFWGWS